MQRYIDSARGFTYIGLLIFIALAGVGLAIVGMTWQQKVRAEKEQQLLFVGNEYRKAFKSYYDATPSGLKKYPATFQDLLLDKRFPVIKRHLRRLYADPMTGKPEWGVYKQQGLITAVVSLSEQVPFKVAKFSKDNQGFAGAKSYKNWIFGQAGGSIEVLNVLTNETLMRKQGNLARDTSQVDRSKNKGTVSVDLVETNSNSAEDEARLSSKQDAAEAALIKPQ